MSAAYDIDGAAAEYSVSPSTIQRAIKAGDLAAKKVGRKHVIGASALAEWFAALPDA